MPSIKDVAKKANVSIATVSNVMSGKRNVSSSLEEKVRLAASELNYEANYIARSMKINRTMTIGMVVTSISRVFFPTVIGSVQNAATQSGYNLMLYITEDNFEKEKQFIKMLLNVRADGIILASVAGNDDKDYFNYLSNLYVGKKRVPVVSLERDLTEHNISSVFVDNVKGGYAATEHLVACGCKKISFICGPANSAMADDRFLGYKKALDNHGIEYDDWLTASGDFSPQTGYSAARKMILDGSAIDGLFASNDQMAIGAIRAILSMGKSVPDDIRVVGYDNSFVTTLVKPSLTTINVPKLRMGKEAFDLLLNSMDSDEANVSGIELPTELMIRQTTNGDLPSNWDMEGW